MTGKLPAIVFVFILLAAIRYLLPIIERLIFGDSGEPRSIAVRGELARDEQSTILVFENASPSATYITTVQIIVNPWAGNVSRSPK